MKKITFEVGLPVSVLREGKQFIAYTHALDLSTSGKTYEEAKKRFAEIVTIFFEEIVKKGTLNQVLYNLGWRQIKKQWTPPVLVSQDSELIQVSV